MARPPPQEVPSVSRYVYNVIPFPLYQQQQDYYLEMVAGKAPAPAKLHEDKKKLKGWILPMDNYFTITQAYYKQQLCRSLYRR